MSSVFNLSPSSSTSKRQAQKHPTTERPSSIHSTSSSHKSSGHFNRIASTWSIFSLDQLPFYSHSAKNSNGKSKKGTRRLSNASHISQFSINSSSSRATSYVEDEATAKKLSKQRTKAAEVVKGFMRVLLLCLNDCSNGFYKIFDHIQRRVPSIVKQKIAVRDLTQKVNIAIADIEDVRENVIELERQIEPFRNMYQMIQASITMASATNTRKKQVDH
ncbi:hypothetical protein BDF20DRAFT_917555 [Mycotypha africana]|uniref:uncharacterized protein n=1 Tax=Mycotypha africana TaxID=64632 RepID=UPI00230172C9|nr:uncharacterized protein BDF20DRAFT_917555 [Mycotypha africana]KAI8967631.1 hypothetical protein BDF20DRAFT_917555 [Mycotypha africana]